MKEVKIANRYAKALFDLAVEKDVLERIKNDAQLVYTVCKTNRDFILMLRSPVIKASKKLSVFKNVFEKSIHALTYEFLVIITKNKREGLIMDISEQFIEIYKKHNNIVTAMLSTAVKIDNDTRESIVNLLKKQTNAKIELAEDVNKDLMGGFVLNFDDKQYDASILRQIQNLRKEFDVNLYIKGF